MKPISDIIICIFILENNNYTDNGEDYGMVKIRAIMEFFNKIEKGSGKFPGTRALIFTQYAFNREFTPWANLVKILLFEFSCCALAECQKVFLACYTSDN